MTNDTLRQAAASFERAERNQLFAEFEEQAVRVSQECSEIPYGDLPSTEHDLPAALLTLLPNTNLQYEQKDLYDYYMSALGKIRPHGVGWLSIHSYMFNNNLGYATFYERREKGTGFYWRLRTVKECVDQPEPAIVVADYAVKSTAPNRSVNWLIATRSKRDDLVLKRDDMQQPSRLSELTYRTLAGTDLMPKSFSPVRSADYERVKLRLLEATTLLGKLTRASAISDLSTIPTTIERHIVSPITYQIFGPRF